MNVSRTDSPLRVVDERRTTEFAKCAPCWEDVCQLTSLCLEGELDEQQQLRLETLLRDDPQPRALYVQFTQESAALQIMAMQVGASSREPISDDARVVRIPLKSRIASGLHYFRGFIMQRTPLSLAIAAVFMVLFLIPFAFLEPSFYRYLTNRTQDPSEVSKPVFVARLTGLHQATWADGQGLVGPRAGANLQRGQCLRLNDGLAQVTYASGAEIILEGPCEYLLSDKNAGRLEIGRLTATVPPQAAGFTVATTGADVVDLGTEFGVEVDDQGDVTASVFAGKVQLRTVELGATVATVDLVAGQVGTAARGSSEIRVNRARDEPFVRRLPNREDWDQVDLVAVKDTYVNSGDYTSRNFGQATELLVKRAELEAKDKTNRVPYFAFDVAAIPRDKIQDASLTLTLTASARAKETNQEIASTFYIYALTQPKLWQEVSLTWDTAQALDVTTERLLDESQLTPLLGTFRVVGRGTRGQKVTIESGRLTALLKTAGDDEITFVITRTRSTVKHNLVHTFASREHPDLPPPTLNVFVAPDDEASRRKDLN